jgi:very-short-patch-repair endonuclease
VADLLARRRALRTQSTDAEALLWRALRSRALLGFKFRRQHPCGRYILDFYCVEKRVCVELDGGQHFEPAAVAYDELRTAFLRRRGITLLRFSNDLVLRQSAAVLEAISFALGVPPVVG